MLAPILDWSIEVKNHARAIAVYWSILIYTALIPTFAKAWSGIVPLFAYGPLFTCDVDTAKECSLEHVLRSQDASIISYDYYTKWVKNCNCWPRTNYLYQMQLQ